MSSESFDERDSLKQYKSQPRLASSKKTLSTPVTESGDRVKVKIQNTSQILESFIRCFVERNIEFLTVEMEHFVWLSNQIPIQATGDKETIK